MAAARDGSIVDLIDWRRPAKGDFIYNPAGTSTRSARPHQCWRSSRRSILPIALRLWPTARAFISTKRRTLCGAQPHRNPLDTRIGGESRLLLDGPHFGVACCVGAPPGCRRLCLIQLLPIDAAVGGDRAGRMRAGRRKSG